MDWSDRVLQRLARIEALRVEALRVEALGGRGTSPDLLHELQALVPEAEAWARAEGDARAHSAVQRISALQKLRGEVKE